MKTAFFFLLLAVVFNVCASIFFKISVTEKNKASTILFVIGLAMGAVNAFFYMKSLKDIKLSIAYPLFSAGSILLMAIFSAILFGEYIGIKHTIGMIVICIGIFIVSLK